MNNWSQNGFKIFLILMKKEGHLINLLNSNIKIIRPAYGLHPKYLNRVIKKKFKNTVTHGY